uniref:Bm493 n=1 Tax=Brugia malayi TaxID=6279 RepID=A0A1I9GD28_BRUMA|nr:Bm493 [Brugia malayi]
MIPLLEWKQRQVVVVVSCRAEVSVVCMDVMLGALSLSYVFKLNFRMATN